MRYLLDTNTISFLMRQDVHVTARLRRHTVVDLMLSTIVLGEGRAGAYRSAKPDRWLALWHHLTSAWEVAPFDALCADHYGRIRANLERQGKMIGHRDCQIAATALAYAEIHGVTVAVVTDNVGEFHRVSGLRVENWAR